MYRPDAARRKTGRPCGVRLVPWLVWLCAAPLFAEPGSKAMYYYVDDGNVVITNTPSRGDVRRVRALDPVAPVGPATFPATPYDGFIERIAVETGLSPGLIKAVATVESGFNPRARSEKGAMGLMQLMPATAARYGVRDAYDPLQNLRAGATHLRHLLDRFDGDLTLALAAYNAGESAVRRHGGVPAYPETQAYVGKVRRSMARDPRRESDMPVAQPPAPPVRMVRRQDGTLVLTN